jgi:hypothetical protein
MLNAAVTMALQNLILAFVALALVWSTLRFLDDHIENDSFADTLKEASPDAKMQYFAYRFLGVCLVVGLVLSG